MSCLTLTACSQCDTLEIGVNRSGSLTSGVYSLTTWSFPHSKQTKHFAPIRYQHPLAELHQSTFAAADAKHSSPKHKFIQISFACVLVQFAGRRQLANRVNCRKSRLKRSCACWTNRPPDARPEHIIYANYVWAARVYEYGALNAFDLQFGTRLFGARAKNRQIYYSNELIGDRFFKPTFIWFKAVIKFMTATCPIIWVAR